MARRTETAELASALALSLALAAPTAVSAAVSPLGSDAHRPDARGGYRPDAHGNYGALKGRLPSTRFSPKFPSRAPSDEAAKQPYPYRYYYDTSRGNYGCHDLAKRAIETNNKNWWLRYRACTEAQRD
jgi:hypothetical protein